MAIENLDGKDPEIYGVFQRPVPAETAFGSSSTEKIWKPEPEKKDETFTPQPPASQLPV